MRSRAKEDILRRVESNQNTVLSRKVGKDTISLTKLVHKVMSP